jgi:hypothetical protein
LKKKSKFGGLNLKVGLWTASSNQQKLKTLKSKTLSDYLVKLSTSNHFSRFAQIVFFRNYITRKSWFVVFWKVDGIQKFELASQKVVCIENRFINCGTG